jgi:HSP20 family protein
MSNLTPYEKRSGLGVFGRDPFESFRQEIDRLFDGFLTRRRDEAGPQVFGGRWPSVDVHESDAAYTVEAEIPGLEAKDVELKLDDNALTLSGEKKQETSKEENGRSYSERSYGRFQRTIPFDVEVDADKVEAAFKNGVLTVTLPKNPKAADKARKIEVKAG